MSTSFLRVAPSYTHPFSRCPFLSIATFKTHKLQLSNNVIPPTSTAYLILRHGSVSDALRSADVADGMKAILRYLQLVQGQIPGTDAARRLMRGQLQSMIQYFGYPLLFVTLNPADVLHPFTWRCSLSADRVPLPGTSLDPHLLEILQNINLWQTVAQDPTAAVQAFHMHVAAFMQTLLDVCTSSPNLHADGIASTNGRGIFGPLSAAFGSIEPQQRGSLHIHFLLFCYSFRTPAALLDNFIDNLALLEKSLWDWVRSIVATSFEAIPPMLGLSASATTSILQQLRPLPYADSNIQAMHKNYSNHIQRSTDNWFAADPERLLPALGPFENFYPLTMPSGKYFIPWAMDYLQELPDDPTFLPNETAKLLLYDLRNSVLASGLLHACQSRTCFKGKLGKRGYCRLGFWHWLQHAPQLWERCHGIVLTPRPLLGTIPPHTDAFLTERHHQFFGKMNPVMLACCKCNHDVSTLLRFPADYITASDPVGLIRNRMATNMATLLYYVTCYTTKTQPQLTSLWSLLHSATQRILESFQNPDPPTAPLTRARSALSRLLLSCQKRVHKSSQEMVSYLLGFDDYYSTHSFKRLFYGKLAAELQTLHAVPGMSHGAAELERQPSIMIQPDMAEVHPDNETPQYTFVSSTHSDYEFRGDDLDDWPFYFYMAGVTRILTTKSALSTPGCIPFAPNHPERRTWRQQVLTGTAWKIPHLMGPRIPSITEDPEHRALLLLLLFKPWKQLSDLLPASAGVSTWSEAFCLWMTALQRGLPDPTIRATALSPAYWAQRTIHIIEHIDDISKTDFTTADRELRLNPDELCGRQSTTIESQQVHQHPQSDTDDTFDTDPLDTDILNDQCPETVTCPTTFVLFHVGLSTLTHLPEFVGPWHPSFIYLHTQLLFCIDLRLYLYLSHSSSSRSCCPSSVFAM